MGGEMTKILPGLFLGNFANAENKSKLSEHNITHVVSALDFAQPRSLDGIKYFRIKLPDAVCSNLRQHFPDVVSFIHEARLSGGAVLVHCAAGVSRSTTIVVAYIMTATTYGWKESFQVVKGVRPIANPNSGFLKQLQEYEHGLDVERKKLCERFPDLKLLLGDEACCRVNLDKYWHWVRHGSSTQAHNTNVQSTESDVGCSTSSYLPVSNSSKTADSDLNPSCGGYEQDNNTATSSAFASKLPIHQPVADHLNNDGSVNTVDSEINSDNQRNVSENDEIIEESLVTGIDGLFGNRKRRHAVIPNETLSAYDIVSYIRPIRQLRRRSATSPK